MAVLDLLTLPEAKAALNLDAAVTAHDTELGSFISAVSLRIDDLCGPVVVRTVTDEEHDGGGRFIVPTGRPVDSVTTIKEYSGTSATTLTAENLAAGTVTANDYHLDPRTSFVHRHASGGRSRFASTRVILTYQAGRFATTATVDGKFKTAAGLTLQHLWRPAAAGWAQTPTFNEELGQLASPVPGWMVPRAVLELLADELLPPAVA